MARVKGAMATRKRRNKTLKLAKDIGAARASSSERQKKRL